MPSSPSPIALLTALASAAAPGQPAVAQDRNRAEEYETVVAATTPLHGSGLPRQMVPANVQTATDSTIAASGSLDLTEFMAGNLGSVHLDQVLGNSLQPDLDRDRSAAPVIDSIIPAVRTI